MTGDAPEKVVVRNAGTRPWTLQVYAAPWLAVSSTEFMLDPGKEQTMIRTFEQGKSYLIMGAGDDDALDVDLERLGDLTQGELVSHAASGRP